MGNEMIPFDVFMIIWSAYALAGLPIYFSKHLRRKRQIFPFYIGGMGFLFLAGMIVTGAPYGSVLLASPIVVVMTILNLKSTRFCERCGSTVVRWSLFKEVHFCPRCGADLREQREPWD